MSAEIIGGPRAWAGSRDDEGNREYTLTYRVKTSDVADGPATVMTCPGLPLPGSAWYIGNDIDSWAFCKLGMQVKPVIDNKPNDHWDVTLKFSTKSDTKKCKDEQIEDPLLQPVKMSGGFTKFQEEAAFDRNGLPIYNSAFEMIRGPQVEFDMNRPTIRFEQNVLNLDLATVAAMVDKVNDSTLWGFPARCVKLSSFTWDQKFYGSCYKYFTRVFEFDFNSRTFDRDVMDEGTKVLRGSWDRVEASATYKQYVIASGVNYLSPKDYIRYKDWNGENARVILNGRGRPYDAVGATTGTADDQVGSIHIEKYGEVDFLSLGLPTVIA